MPGAAWHSTQQQRAASRCSAFAAAAQPRQAQQLRMEEEHIIRERMAKPSGSMALS